MTLLDAISQAGGLTSDAGGQILVSLPGSPTDETASPHVEQIPVHGLFDAVEPSLNLTLHGGEVIRIPEAGRVYVVGNVNKPGAFPITDDSQSSVLKMLALSGGLEHYTQNTAYVYRMQDSKSSRSEIPIELKMIMDRKAPDVALLADDILYIPEATSRKNTLTALNRIALVGVGLSASLLILYR
jgi:protein involved in polysaccharide export with SLBB domain